MTRCFRSLLVALIAAFAAIAAEPADCIIINADGESPDATARLFLETPTRCRKQSLITTPHRGKGSNMVNILRYCREHEIAALAFIDTDIH